MFAISKDLIKFLADIFLCARIEGVQMKMLISGKLSRCGNDFETHKSNDNFKRSVNNFIFLFLFHLQIESVELALKILDDYDIRGKKISVQRAEFQMRGEYNPALKPRKKKHEKEKEKKAQEKWVVLRCVSEWYQIYSRETQWVDFELWILKFLCNDSQYSLITC